MPRSPGHGIIAEFAASRQGFFGQFAIGRHADERTKQERRAAPLFLSLGVDELSRQVYIMYIQEKHGMVTKVQKWGNSLGVRIPKALVEQVGVSEGTPVHFSVESGRLVLTPAKKKKNLADLLRRITAANTHGETDFGHPQGREVW